MLPSGVTPCSVSGTGSKSYLVKREIVAFDDSAPCAESHNFIKRRRYSQSDSDFPVFVPSFTSVADANPPVIPERYFAGTKVHYPVGAEESAAARRYVQSVVDAV